MTGWQFDQAGDVAAVTSLSVLEGDPILLVVHYSDDHSWAFLDGGELNEEDGRLVAMEDMLQLDPSLAGIADLAPGWIARRTAPEAQWTRAPDPEV